jgi:integrase
VTLNGRDFYLGNWDAPESRHEYDRLVAEWLANGRRLPEAVPQDELTVLELVAAYLEFARGYYVSEGENTKEYIAMRDVLKPVVHLYGRTLVKSFGPLALKALRQKMVEKGLVRQSVNREVHRIRRVFKWGVENELVPPLVLEGLRAVAPLKKGRTDAPESRKVKPVPDEHVDAVLSLVSRQVAAMIQLQRLAGMRPGEVTLIRPCDVDRTGDVWVYFPMRHKTEHHDLAREIYLGPRAQEILLPWLLRDPESFCFSPVEAEAERNALRRANRRTPLTPSQAKRQAKKKPKRSKRSRYDRDSYRRAIEYAITKAGVQHWHPHQLRHSCGTRMRHDFGLDVAQLVLGHQSVDVSQVYAHANRTKAMAVMAKVG